MIVASLIALKLECLIGAGRIQMTNRQVVWFWDHRLHVQLLISVRLRSSPINVNFDCRFRILLMPFVLIGFAILGSNHASSPSLRELATLTTLLADASLTLTIREAFGSGSDAATGEIAILMTLLPLPANL